MILVGITGFRRAGKTSAASFLERAGFKVYAFADPLRAMARAVDPLIELAGMPDELRAKLGDFDPAGWGTAMRYTHILAGIGYEAAKDIPDVRRYLQKLGTEGVRMNLGPTAWVDALAYRLGLDRPRRAVVNDVRFREEVDFILRRGGVLWRVNRPGVGGNDLHASERDIPSLPASLDITATNLEELETQVVAALANLIQTRMTNADHQTEDTTQAVNSAGTPSAGGDDGPPDCSSKR